jgi:hypothetical protein
MADLSTPSAAAMFDGGAEKKKPEITKPEKPNEETYAALLKQAEKEHADANAKFVCSTHVQSFYSSSLSHVLR